MEEEVISPTRGEEMEEEVILPHKGRGDGREEENVLGMGRVNPGDSQKKWDRDLKVDYFTGRKQGNKDQQIVP